MESEPRVGEIGEQALLALVQSFCPAEWVGDDAALLAVPPGELLVATSDVLVDGIHFSDRTTTAEDAGWRAAAANLSDLAAMGARPLALTASLSLPREQPVAWVADLYRGLAACAQTYGTAIAGGDLSRSPTVAIAITALGSVPPEGILRRSAAQPGDALVATGPHGASRAGLELLLHPEAGAGLSATERDAFIRAHQRPRPRFDVVQAVAALRSEAGDRPLAAMDSSDGLADAIWQLCRASGVGARLQRQALPIPAAFASWLPPAQALNWTLYGGEDFELVLCLPPELAQALVARLGPTAALVGYATRDPAIVLVTDCDEPPQTLDLSSSFQHF